MDLFLHLLGQYGLPIVFLAVLLEQGGLPLPAYPIIIAASSLAVESAEPAWPIVLVTALAALIADFAWFVGGRRFGGRMLRLMCSLSLSRDSCVGGARETFARWGLPSLIIAKFVPGLAAVATTLAGQMRIEPRRFLLYDGAGALLWSLAAVALGVVFHDVVNDVLLQLDAWGSYGLLVLLAIFVAFVGCKAWQRWRFRKQNRMARITVAQLKAMLDNNQALAIVDVRTAAERAEGWIPGAVLHERLADLAAASEVVVYCDCPGEASAAVLARKLVAEGVTPARPLLGGFKAWKDAGLPVQYEASPEQSIAESSGPEQAPTPSDAGKDGQAGAHSYAGGK